MGSLVKVGVAGLPSSARWLGARYGRRNGQLATDDLGDLRVLRLKGSHDEVGRFSRIECRTAREDIHGRIPEFGPGVDTQVGFSDGDHSSHALGRELMKDLADDRRPGFNRSVHHRAFQIRQIV